MLQYRVTKYDPSLRDHEGRYTPAEWTSVSDIGRSFGGVTLSHQAYQRVEDAYVAVAREFVEEARLSFLVVTGLEHLNADPLPFDEGSILTPEQLVGVVRRMLREEFWCRLEGEAGFVHIGHDFYMYLGVPRRCPGSEGLAQRLGLFVEDFRSPYIECESRDSE